MSQNKIYVGNLSYSVTEEDLNEFFGQYGELEEAKLIMDRATGRSKGFAFIKFVNQQAVQAALAADGKDLKGRNMKVNMAKEDVRRRSNGGGGNPRRQNKGFSDQRW